MQTKLESLDLGSAGVKPFPLLPSTEYGPQLSLTYNFSTLGWRESDMQ